jgi:hypothetical protein
MTVRHCVHSSVTSRHSHLAPILNSSSVITAMKNSPGAEARAARERPPLRGHFHCFRAPQAACLTHHSSLITHHSLLITLITVQAPN